MKNILLTGGTGFLGSHIIEDLSEKYNIIVLKRSYSDVTKIDKIISRVTCYNIDEENIETIFDNHKIDAIIHTATNYGRSYRYLADIIDSNLYLPMRLIDLGIRYNVEAFLNTDTFWDENIELPIGLKYYALTKKDFLKYAHLAILENQSMKFLNLKIEHLYGPRDDEKKFLPFVLSTFIDGNSNIKLTKGEQKRDFIYVKDAVSAYECILENLGSISSFIEDYDVGTGKVLTIREIIEKAQEILSSHTELLFGALEYRKGEAMEAKADIAKLTAIGWKSEYTVDQGLRNTINSMQTS